MKLLILGLLLIGIVLIQIYYTNKNKEDFQNNVDKALVAGERSFLQGQDKHWDVRKQGIGAGLLVTKPGINDWFKLDSKSNLQKYTPKVGIEQGVVDKGIVNCRQITKCSQINSSNNCGYCAYDKEFRYGTKNGPSADVCPKEVWTTDANKCAELREKQLCAAVKSCGDLYGEAAKTCGFCPTTGKSMVMKKVGDKYVPKYSDDVCSSEGYGLIPGDKCGKFAEDHPCITPYYLSGPHTANCVKKLWKNSKCTDATPYGQTPKELGAAIRMPYKQVGTIMQGTNDKTRSIEYDEAVENSDLCFGNHKNIKPCDEKYNRQGIPHPACLRKIFKETGCTEQGTDFASIKGNDFASAKNQVGNVSTYSRAQSGWGLPGITYPFSEITSMNEYTKTMKRVYDLTVGADDYDTRKKTSLLCLGTKPRKPPAVKPGDTVLRQMEVKEGLLKFEGIVIGMRGNDCRIMWYQSTDENGIVRKREGMSLDDQKKYYGWDGIPPTYNKELKPWIHKGRLNIKRPDGECSTNKSTCAVTCKDKIRNILYKYPRPRDCIVGQWKSWSECSKPCGGGEQSRSRDILYPDRYGGRPCPELNSKRVCNTDPCLNPNFKSKKYKTKGISARYVKVLSGGSYIQIPQLAVYSSDAPNVNIALRKPASSNGYGWGGAPSLAVDGDLTPHAHYKGGRASEFHSRGGRGYWWQVDLQKEYPISKVVYYNRTDCCSSRANGMKFQLIDNIGQVVYTSSGFNTNRIQTFDI